MKLQLESVRRENGFMIHLLRKSYLCIMNNASFGGGTANGAVNVCTCVCVIVCVTGNNVPALSQLTAANMNILRASEVKFSF